ncbi:MAG: Lrp/AsnC family transcriptional regulator [Firmicutes bacterium]|nr:Lrp/AsnC family transcriptional regulator [Bacillota bacterium]
MDKLHEGILKILAEDSRTPAAKLATALGATEAAVTAALKALEKSGALLKYTVVVNDEKLDKEYVEALIEVKVAPMKSRGFDAIAEDICAFCEVKSMYLMSGGYDLAVMVEGRTLKEVAMFVSEKLSSLDKVLSTATRFILKKYKQGGVLMENEGGKRLAFHV